MENAVDPCGLVFLLFPVYGDAVCEMHPLYAAGVSDTLSAGGMGIDKTFGDGGIGWKKVFSFLACFFVIGGSVIWSTTFVKTI